VLAVAGALVAALVGSSAAASSSGAPLLSYSKAASHQKVFRKLLRSLRHQASKRPKQKPRPVPDTRKPKPQPPPAPVPPAANGAQRFGVSPDNLEFEDAATRNRTLDSLAQMGARWIRFDVKWDVIQYGGLDSFDFSRYDALTSAAAARGLRVLGTLAYAPRWARSDACKDSFPCQPRDPAQYARYAEKTAAHFRGRIDHWEIWNEPNISGFWRPRPSAALYTALLKAAYPRIKAANPGAVVLAGATSPAPNDGTQIDEVTFLEQVYVAGGGGHFDAWSHHPYTHPAPPGNVHPDCAWYQIYGSKPNIRDTMKAHGDGAKKVWGTEYGPPTAGSPGSVSEATQAQWVTKAYSLWSSYDWAGPLFWYADRDQLPLGASGDAWNYYGLLREDFSPKPAWSAYRAAALAAA
jgi:polysaccharide biosynthesis protein PslG